MPSTSISQLHPQVWTFTQPLSRSGIIKIGVRGTAIILQNKDIFFINPVDTKEDGALIKAKLDELGTVKWIVCPNRRHHFFAKDFKKLYPNALLMGIEELSKAKKELHFDIIYGKNYPMQKWGFEGEIDTTYFSGFINRDIAFVHRPSKILIVADLIWNLPAKESYSLTKTSPTSGVFSWLGSLFMKPHTCLHKVFLFLAGLRDRQSIRIGAKIVSEWDFETIVVAHGEIITRNAKGTWRVAYKGYL